MFFQYNLFIKKRQPLFLLLNLRQRHVYVPDNKQLFLSCLPQSETQLIR